VRDFFLPDVVPTSRFPGERLARALVASLFALAMAGIAMAAMAGDIWYEDNNLGKAGGMPADFVEKFSQPDAFKQASRYIDVYMVRANLPNEMDDHFLTTQFFPYLRQHDIRLAINAGGATWARMPGRKSVDDKEFALLRRLERLGMEVDYISLQSVLSKPLRVRGQRVDYPISKRIEDVVAYARVVRTIHPRIQIGIIDALPSHGEDYRQPYRLLRDALAREGIPLAYIHLDMPFELPREQQHGLTWQKVREVERYVEEDLGLKFGFFTTSREGGLVSSKAFHDRVMAALECYAGADGTPGDFIIASWFPHPQKTIPETATGDDYPAMRTVLEFGRQLERIEKQGPRLSAHGASQSGWRRLCTMK